MNRKRIALLCGQPEEYCQDLFIKGFNSKLIKKADLTPNDICCEKFFVLKNSDYLSAGGNSLSIEYLLSNLSDGVVESFNKDYNTDINTLYEYTGTYSANCFSDSFYKAEHFKKLYYSDHPLKEKFENIAVLTKKGVKKIKKTIKK